MLQRQLGQLVLNRIVESERADFDPLGFFPETTPEDWTPHKAWLQPRAMDPASGNLIFPMQSWLVRTRHHTILVDTCIGDHKKRQRPSWHMTTGGVFLAQLAAAGVRPEAVDYVLCTHLHVDHVGWNTQLRDGRWVPNCDTDVLICGTHFPSPSMGHIVPHGNAFRFAYEQTAD